MPRLFQHLALILCLIWPGALLAQPYPDHRDLYVNDLAGLLTPDETQRLRDQLTRLREDKGVQMTVLTIRSRKDYGASPSIEDFATGLFNDWGIGRKDVNEGILVLVAQADREMRVELGKGYDQGFDPIAQDIVDRNFVPAFRDGQYGAGIEAGVNQIIRRIAEPRAANLPPEKAPFDIGRLVDKALPFTIFGGIAALIGVGFFGRRLSDWSYRYRSCPTCGARGLNRDRIWPDTVGGYGHLNTWCPHCSYRDDRTWRAAPRNRNSDGGGGGSFGGGSSSGGGATGRW